METSPAPGSPTQSLPRRCSPSPCPTRSTDVVATTYTGCDDDVPLVFHEVVDGGHTWPSSPLADMLTEFQGYITFDIDATADSWAFFEQHTLGP